MCIECENETPRVWYNIKIEKIIDGKESQTLVREGSRCFDCSIKALEEVLTGIKERKERRALRLKEKDIIFLLHLMEKYEMTVDLFLDEEDRIRLDNLWRKMIKK
ncbi:MAG: hypothetical protein ACOC56_01010 [Atribacterota bacterium]